jgi:hypothetical protein
MNLLSTMVFSLPCRLALAPLGFGGDFRYAVHP